MDKGMGNALGESMHVGLTSGVMLLLNDIFENSSKTIKSLIQQIFEFNKEYNTENIY